MFVAIKAGQLRCEMKGSQGSQLQPPESVGILPNVDLRNRGFEYRLR